MRKELEETFEEYLMSKYPELFPQDEQGNPLPSSCGVGGQEEWKDIIDNLCGAIVQYTKTSFKSEKNPNKLIRLWYFLWDKLWKPIHNKLYKLLNPYNKYAPKDSNGIWIIPKDVQKKVEGSRREKVRKKLFHLTYHVLLPSDAFITKPSCPKVTIAQIKSKFGELRFYIDGGDDAVYGMIRFAEHLCEQETKKRNLYNI
jgi:hypothetical protein